MKTGEIAEVLGREVRGDGNRDIRGVAALEAAAPDEVAYVDSEKNLQQAGTSHAGCLIVPLGTQLEGFTLLLSPYPKYDFARLAALLHPLVPPPPGIHPTAILAPTARLGPQVSIGPYAIIEDQAVIGARSCIGAFCYLGSRCHLGEEVFLYPRVTLYSEVKLAARVTVHSGTVLGSDGFGYVEHEGRYIKFPQIGGLLIEEDVEIGSNVSIDRGSLGITRIGRGTKIDNLVQVAHNVVIEEDVVIAAQTGISGSSSVGHHAVVAGQVGIADHVRIEEHARIGAQAGIPTGKTIRKREFVWGTPARPMEVFKEQYGGLSRLPRLRQEMADFKKRVAELEKMLKNQRTTD